ncbi:MAG: biotin--[acetyl-CoA-carboxylase] ligase [Pseudomonadota bacterium]|nr:MAG: biotin--[acetyl-CoA-carboxylase] ligase [Pseudomonadota bacterium]
MRPRFVVHHRQEVDSTNEEARRLARAGAGHFEAVVADVQTAGRGRRGRSWIGLSGQNLFLSVILRPDMPAARAPRLVAVCAVAVAEALRSFGADARIKWPNDVEVSGRKICGILLELSARGENVDFAVAGIGVNLEGDLCALGPEVAARATTLQAELGIRPGRDEVLRRILEALWAQVDRLQREGFDPIRQRYLELSSTVGARVRLAEPERMVEGVAVDVDGEGALWVEIDGGGRERFLSGDLVTLRRIE